MICSHTNFQVLWPVGESILDFVNRDCIRCVHSLPPSTHNLILFPLSVFFETDRCPLIITSCYWSSRYPRWACIYKLCPPANPRNWKHGHPRSLFATSQKTMPRLCGTNYPPFVDDPTSSSSVTKMKKDKSKTRRGTTVIERDTPGDENQTRGSGRVTMRIRCENAGKRTRKPINSQLRKRVTRWPRSSWKTNPNGANENASRICENRVFRARSAA
jgi:hypothetical protein